ncbi:MAG: DUF5979 domain-containing protein, partial [Eubacterium sp.]|nr:DUF5979 domain-containing protein [Eubacterium sp.]
MRIKKNVKRILSFGMATVMAVSLLVTGGGSLGQVEAAAPPMQDSASSINFSTILGGAIDYGIVADHLIQDGHMETTFATNTFTHVKDANEVDYIANDKTAHFIVNSIDKSVGLAAPYMVLGHTTAANIYLEATAEAFGGYDGTLSNKNGGPNGNILFSGDLENSTTVTMAKVENPNASDNVDRFIKKISDDSKNEWSKKLSDKAGSDQYKLPSDYISYKNPENPSSGGVSINIDSEEFKNKVVYINVDDTMLKSINSEDGALSIYKDPSTVVVFNIEDKAVNDAYGEDGEMPTKHFFVYSEGKKIGSTTNPGGGNKPEGQNGSYGGSDEDVDYIVVDKKLCQSIIWNIRTDNDVVLDSMAGTMLVPNANVKFSNGNISGWLVAGKTVNTNGVEFHYTYSGNSYDGYGEMHFSLRKGFVDKYGSKADTESSASGTPTANTSIDIKDGDFKFIWQEYSDGTFADSKKKGTAVERPITYLGSVQFPTVDFASILTTNASETDNDETETSEGTTKYYKTATKYFRITEAPSNTIAGVSNSAGYIDVVVKARRDEAGNFTYKIYSKTMSGEDADHLIEYHKNGNYDPTTQEYTFVDMGGVQYDLGAFYNKVDACLLVEKKVKGDYTPQSTDEYQIRLKNTDTNKYYKEDGSEATSESDAIVTIKANEKVAFSNLPAGKYIAEEVEATAEKTGYDLNVTTSGEASVIAGSSSIPTITVTNDYSASGKLTVKKSVEGDYADASTKTYTFKVKCTSGANAGKYLKADNSFDTTGDSFDVKVGEDKKFINLPAGTYTVEEDEPDSSIYDDTKYEWSSSVSGDAIIAENDKDEHEVTIT